MVTESGQPVASTLTHYSGHAAVYVHVATPTLPSLPIYMNIQGLLESKNSSAGWHQ